MKNRNYKSIGKNVIELEINALKKLKNSINESFNQAVDVISNCQSKIIFCGDFDQTDLIKQNERNGLHDFLRILEEMEEFNCLEFSLGDIVRSGFVRSYLINKIKLGVGTD